MDRVKYRYVGSSVEGDSADLAKIVRVLNLAGCSAGVSRLNSGDVMCVEIPDDIERRLTRNAGIKRIGVPEGSPLSGMSEAEAMAWCKEHAIEEAAAALGIAVSTAYARIRKGRVLPREAE